MSEKSNDRERMRLLSAMQFLQNDPRVDRDSLRDRRRRMRRHGDPRNRADLGAEIRFAARLLYRCPDLSHLSFAEAPDIRATAFGEPVTFEVKRARRTDVDARADVAIEAARGTGYLATVCTGEEAQEAAERLARLLFEKLGKLRPVPGSAIVVVGDSDWTVDGTVVRMALRRAIDLGAPRTVGAVVVCDTTGTARNLPALEVRAEFVTAALRGAIDSLGQPTRSDPY